MSCNSPITAWRNEDGCVVFKETRSAMHQLQLPCGQCWGCRLDRSQAWGVRCVHEAQMHEHSCFVTLTYDEERCPASLRYKDFRLFMRSLRRRLGKARFYMCGEYGERTLRPHYHACLFGVHFPDRTPWKVMDSGFTIYRSKMLEELWPHGFASIGDVTLESAAYVARYIMKRVTGAPADLHYLRVDKFGQDVRVEPEFCRMSLRPGIGAKWLQRYAAELLTHDKAVIDGRYVKLPRYYDKIFARVAARRIYEPEDFRLFTGLIDCRSEIDENEYLRFERGMANLEERSEARLVARETVLRAKMRSKLRTLE